MCNKQLTVCCEEHVLSTLCGTVRHIIDSNLKIMCVLLGTPAHVREK